jgi:hypothetical protein
MEQAGYNRFSVVLGNGCFHSWLVLIAAQHRKINKALLFLNSFKDAFAIGFFYQKR